MTGTVLDHVAVAVERWPDAWDRFVVGLGGRWRSGGLAVGFGPAQLEYDGGAKVEILQPWDWERNDFLRRFLDNSGPGPHHLTFKVPDLDYALAQARHHGFTPVGVDRSDPQWQEAFLHPRHATGVVVQLAQAAGDWTSPAPEGFPPPVGPRARLLRVVHAVADLDRARLVFETLLGGHVVGANAKQGSWRAIELAWEGPLRLCLVSPVGGSRGHLSSWIGERPGRVHHLAFDISALSHSQLEALEARLAPLCVGDWCGSGSKNMAQVGEASGTSGSLEAHKALIADPDSATGTRLLLVRHSSTTQHGDEAPTASQSPNLEQ